MKRTIYAVDLDLMRWALHARGVAKHQMAAAISATPSEVTHIIGGKLPSPWARAKIARLLCVDVDRLYRPIEIEYAEEDAIAPHAGA